LSGSEQEHGDGLELRGIFAAVGADFVAAVGAEFADELQVADAAFLVNFAFGGGEGIFAGIDVSFGEGPGSAVLAHDEDVAFAIGDDAAGGEGFEHWESLSAMLTTAKGRFTTEGAEDAEKKRRLAIVGDWRELRKSVTQLWCSGGIGGEKERKELALHFLAARDDGDADKKGFVGVGHDAILEDVNHRCAARTLCVVGTRAVHRASVVERSFPFFEFDRDGIELVLQRDGEAAADGVHFSGENGLGQVGPFVAAGDVVEAAVLPGGVVETNPASEVREGRGARPVRIILVPGHDASVLRGLAKELVVPEAHRAIEQLRCGNEKRGIPEQIVEAGQNAPGAEGVEEDAVRVGGFIGVVFVKEVAAGMRRVHELLDFGAKDFDLIIGEDTHAGEIAVFAKEGDLGVGEAVAVVVLP
jgi:hypothetical protein